MVRCVSYNELEMKLPTILLSLLGLASAFGPSGPTNCEQKVPLNVTVPFSDCTNVTSATKLWCQDCDLPESCCMGGYYPPTNPQCGGIPENCSTVDCCSGCKGLCASNTPIKNLNCWSCLSCCFHV